jgi:excisionase family DNA binding protein
MEDRFVMPVRKAARLLEISEPELHDAITRGELRATHNGSRVLVSAADVARRLRAMYATYAGAL